MTPFSKRPLQTKTEDPPLSEESSTSPPRSDELFHPPEGISGASQAPEEWQNLITAAASSPHHLPEGIALNQPLDTEAVTTCFPMRINAFLLASIKSGNDAWGKQLIPQLAEFEDRNRPVDPLHEETQSPVPLVVHRYHRRVAFLVSNQCAVYCRFCMRKRRVGGEAQISANQLSEGIDYIRNNSVINEVILTGGDPLMLPNSQLNELLCALRRIRHVRILRLHTRIPVALPQRITPDLVQMLSFFHPIYVNIHVNHPGEITPEAALSCALMADSGIPLGSQTVLLKGINDNPQVLTALMEGLLSIRVRPYYIHQLDRVPGTAHFKVPLVKSIGLVETLRGRLSGMAVPHFMIDLPRGGGKIALTPDVVVKKGESVWKIRNWQGKVYSYKL